jgi:hypothetical protein
MNLKIFESPGYQEMQTVNCTCGKKNRWTYIWNSKRSKSISYIYLNYYKSRDIIK